MRLFFFVRPAKPEHHFLVVEFSKNAEFNPLVTQIKDKVDVNRMMKSGS